MSNPTLRPMKRRVTWCPFGDGMKFRNWLFFTWRIFPMNTAGQIIMGSNKAKTGFRILGVEFDYEGGY